MERHVPARSDTPLLKRNCYNKFSKGGTGWNVTFPRDRTRRCRNVTVYNKFSKGGTGWNVTFLLAFLTQMMYNTKN